MELEKRFWRKVKKTEGCWLWQGANETQGRGVINVRGRSKLAYRVSYELAYGPIPEGQCILHSCDNQACVRPDHLTLGDRYRNNQERHARGRTVTGRSWMPIEQRLDLQIKRNEKTECWEWQGTVHRQGYGTIMWNHKRMAAHRASYIVHRGPIPEGKILLHQCDNSLCINPDHLRVGTREENAREMCERGRNACGERHGHHGSIEFSNPILRAQRISAGLNRPETKARIVEKRIEMWANRTDEEKAELGRKIAASQKGRSFSPEHLANLRAAHAARRGTERSIPWNKGMACSEETKQKISETKKERQQT